MWLLCSLVLALPVSYLKLLQHVLCGFFFWLLHVLHEALFFHNPSSTECCAAASASSWWDVEMAAKNRVDFKDPKWWSGCEGVTTSEHAALTVLSWSHLESWSSQLGHSTGHLQSDPPRCSQLGRVRTLLEAEGGEVGNASCFSNGVGTSFRGEWKWQFGSLEHGACQLEVLTSRFRKWMALNSIRIQRWLGASHKTNDLEYCNSNKVS